VLLLPVEYRFKFQEWPAFALKPAPRPPQPPAASFKRLYPK
jgi:hypothetical protein